MMSAGQNELFPQSLPWPHGFSYREEFVSPGDEIHLLEQISRLPLQESRYGQWTAKRRTLSFGGQYDFTRHELNPAAPIPRFLHPLRAQLARWLDMDAGRLTHASIAEYRPGTQLGWHRDVPDFEIVAGVSFAGMARMRFRPYSPASNGARTTCAIDLQPRSAYIIRNAARWKWQHAISATTELRYSITFRTLRARSEVGKHKSIRLDKQ